MYAHVSIFFGGNEQSRIIAHPYSISYFYFFPKKILILRWTHSCMITLASKLCYVIFFCSMKVNKAYLSGSLLKGKSCIIIIIIVIAGKCTRQTEFHVMWPLWRKKYIPTNFFFNVTSNKKIWPQRLFLLLSSTFFFLACRFSL